MTINLHLSAGGSLDLHESLSAEQQRALLEAVAKIVAWGAHVGVGTDELIALLRSGLTVVELLDYLNARTRNVA
ncbi:MAG: hypothetical protein ABSD75_14020 [Terriglobales bacterium]|jgi:hypothetical protein